jgi:hypothetical protein
LHSVRKFCLFYLGLEEEFLDFSFLVRTRLLCRQIGKLFKSIAIETRATSGNIEYIDTGATVSSAAVSYRVLAL